MIEIVDYLPEHLEKIDLRDKLDIKSGISTVALTFLLEGEPIAIIGWYFITEGVAHVWTMISDGITKCPLSFHKSVKILIQYGFEKFKLRRMQMSVRCGYDMAFKWARSLGFNCEGVMKNYGHDYDAYLFARVI